MLFHLVLFSHPVHPRKLNLVALTNLPISKLQFATGSWHDTGATRPGGKAFRTTGGPATHHVSRQPEGGA